MTQADLDRVHDDKAFAAPQPAEPFWWDAMAMLAIAGIAVLFVLAVRSL